MNSDTSKLEQQKQVVFFIEKEQHKVEHDQLTVDVLIRDYAKEDPAKVTLGLKEGNTSHKYIDVNEAVKLKNGMKFVIFHNEPTTVS